MNKDKFMLSPQLLKLLHNCEDHSHFYSLSAVHICDLYHMYIISLIHVLNILCHKKSTLLKQVSIWKFHLEKKNYNNYKHQEEDFRKCSAVWSSCFSWTFQLMKATSKCTIVSALTADKILNVSCLSSTKRLIKLTLNSYWNIKSFEIY